MPDKIFHSSFINNVSLMKIILQEILSEKNVRFSKKIRIYYRRTDVERKKSRGWFFGEWILEKTRWQTSDDADLFSEGGSSLDQYAPFW